VVSRAGVYVLEDRVFLRWVEVRRTDDDTPHVGLSVASLSYEHFRSLPSVCNDFRDVGSLKVHHKLACLCVPQDGNRCVCDCRCHIHNIFLVSRKPCIVHSFRRCHVAHVASVEADAVVSDEIWVFILVHSAGLEPYAACILIHVDDAADIPVSLCDLVLHLACSLVIEVEVIVVVALAHPDDLAVVLCMVAELA